MKLIDFLTSNTEDVDLYVDGIDGIAVCSADDIPMLTPLGIEHFKACFDLEVEYNLIEGTDEDYDAMYDYEDGKTEDGGRMYLAWEFISALAGYCSCSDFDKWFDIEHSIKDNFFDTDNNTEVYAVVHSYRDEKNGLDNTSIIGIYASKDTAISVMEKEFANAKQSMIEDEGYEEDELDCNISTDLREIYKSFEYDIRNETFRLFAMPIIR